MIALKIKDELIKGYLCYASILVAKVLCMVFLTGRQRFGKKVFMNYEDLPALKSWFNVNGFIKHDDKDVERVRSAHINDLENIPIFIFIGFVYILSNPDTATALNIFKIFTWSRIFYTMATAYFMMPQFITGIAWMIGYSLTCYMTIISMITFF